MTTLRLALLTLVLAACGGQETPPLTPDEQRVLDEYRASKAATAEESPLKPTPTPAITDLPAYFDCVREAGGALIAAHRGGPTDGYPENALQTLEYGVSQGIRIFEIDVAESRDGMLTLMHDRRLNRTTTGDGYVADTDWPDMSRLRLVDNNGTITAFNPPKLSDVLLWAKESGAILELDRKNTTNFANIISAVEAAGAENNVILISYDDDEAATIARLGPRLMLTASARGGRDIAALEARGIDRTRLIAWTGTRAADEAAWQRLRAEGVEPAFGTLGRPGDRLDDVYWADDDGREYDALISDGLTLLATDTPYRAAAAMRADDVARESCGG